jgi:FkbM family methyltransferase
MKINNTTETIKIVNDIHVTIPSSLQLMTPYVLHEQGDWFEDEIKFLRAFIKPGMEVVDIGANYGLYTLTIAKLVGEEGKVSAFEPTGATAACLRHSIVNNKFNNIDLIQAGLSDGIREADFFTSPNSELNSLSNVSASGAQHETVSLLTLDHCAKEYQWGDVDFIKLDAEGEESNILKSGKSFLSSSSPLVMFELKHGSEVNLSLINDFERLGYESYRLIPGLDVLVPFSPAEPVDGYLLNLFCCKKDKAALLEAEQVIVRGAEPLDCLPDLNVVREYFLRLPCGESINNLNFESSVSKDYEKILTAYALAHSESSDASEKVGYLLTALNCLRQMLKSDENRIEHLATYARIAFDAGERALGVQILTGLINKYINNMNFEVSEPVLPVASRYGSICPSGRIKEWLFSSVIEQYTSKHAYSTYFTRRATLPLLGKLRGLGFMSDAMKKTEQMIQKSFPS